MPSKVWDVMNDLEMVTTKVCSAREIINAAIHAIDERQMDKAATLMEAANEFLDYYLDEFKIKFNSAWKETVQADHRFQYTEEEIDEMCAAAEVEQDMENIREYLQDKNTIAPLKKWVLPVVEEDDECIINFPDDLLEAANLKEGDQIEWTPQLDGSCLMRKIPTNYIYESPDQGQTVYQRKFGTTRGYNHDVSGI